MAAVHWDHLRTFEAVARLGSLTAAAKALEVSQSTVSRQLARLEEQAGSPLLLRTTPLRLTQRGEVLLVAAQAMVEAALVAEAALEERPELHGQVTITTVSELIRWVLVDALDDFYNRYPRLRLRLLADNQVTSLAAGEADLALRFVRPERGDVFTQKLHTESYGLFAASHLVEENQPETPWLGLGGSLAAIPEQRWAEQVFADRPPRLLVEDVEALGLAVAAGLGAAVLPRAFALLLEGVVEVEPEQIGALDLGPIASRDLWLVVHRSKRELPKIRAVMDWVRGLPWTLAR